MPVKSQQQTRWCGISSSGLGLPLPRLYPLYRKSPHCQSLPWVSPALRVSVLSATMGAVTSVLLGRKLRHRGFSDRPEFSQLVIGGNALTPTVYLPSPSSDHSACPPLDPRCKRWPVPSSTHPARLCTFSVLPTTTHSPVQRPSLQGCTPGHILRWNYLPLLLSGGGGHGLVPAPTPCPIPHTAWCPGQSLLPTWRPLRMESCLPSWYCLLPLPPGTI